MNMNDIKPCFDPRNLPSVKMTEQIFMRPIKEDSLESDAHALTVLLMSDRDTRKFMPQFAGPEARQNIPAYLFNSVMTQQMGIAFTYVIRMNSGICGLIKVTSPVHNRVTNNFDGWLIDYILTPPFRNHKLMKVALPVVFQIMEKRLGIKDPVYAMVLPENEVSIHLLTLNNFKVDNTKNMTVDPTTGKKAILYKKIL